MKVERSNIKFPLWRKKVDSSLLKNSESIESINISDYILKNKAIDKN